jgi:hypothetical protein
MNTTVNLLQSPVDKIHIIDFVTYNHKYIQVTIDFFNPHGLLVQDH